MKKYLSVQITRHDGSMFCNPLKLSESHLIGKMVKENKSLHIVLMTCTIERYKSIFG
jgi:hypothetical protein